MASAEALRMLVRMYREGHPDATADAMAGRLEDAAQTIEYLFEHVTMLNTEKWEAFCKALDNPPKPSEKLIELMKSK